MQSPTTRQLECFETYARVGRYEAAALELGISIQRIKANVSEYYRRIGANGAIQAAYLTWGPNGRK